MSRNRLHLLDAGFVPSVVEITSPNPSRHSLWRCFWVNLVSDAGVRLPVFIGSYQNAIVIAEHAARDFAAPLGVHDLVVEGTP